MIKCGAKGKQSPPVDTPRQNVGTVKNKKEVRKIVNEKKEQVEEVEDIEKFFAILAVKGAVASQASLDRLNGFSLDPIGDITTDGNGRKFLGGEEI
ncbi:MAG: hypothetical protein AAB497_02540 [Patescibacteria group bacterium]